MVNHLKGSPTEEKRNVLEQSARRARGDIHGLAELNFSKLDVVIVPGESDESCEANCSFQLLLPDFKALFPKGWCRLSYHFEPSGSGSRSAALKLH